MLLRKVHLLQSHACGGMGGKMSRYKKGKNGTERCSREAASSKEQGRFFSRLFGDGYDAFCMQVQGEVGKELSGL